MDTKTTGTLGKRAVAVWVVALTALALAWCGTARAGTVTDEGGGTGAGTLRQVVGSALDGQTITFDAAVKTILLDGKAESAAKNLTITDRMGGFKDATQTLLLQYGINALNNTADFSGIGPDGVDETALLAALRALPLPEVTIDGQEKTRLLEFTAAYAPLEKTKLSGLTLQNANQSFKHPGEDNSSKTDSSNSSADASVANTRSEAQGGALRIVGAGELTSMAVIDNTLSISGGTAKAGTIDGILGGASASADANAYASGGGAYLGDDSTISSSLFLGNKASATGGEATGGTFKDAVTVSNITIDISDPSVDVAANASAEANAFASGGGAYLGDGGTISSSLFHGNIASATGGEASGGTFKEEITISNISISTTPQPSAPSVNAAAIAGADASAKAYGGGAYLGEGGTISSSLFQGNTASATGGKASGGTFEKKITVFNIDTRPSMTATAYATAYANAYANAKAYGGGAYLGKDSEISSSLFQGNTASATGGEASGGTFEKEITISDFSVYPNRSVNVTADANADANAYGGGAYLGDGGTISSSLFLGNTASATGGEARGGTFAEEISVDTIRVQSPINVTANANANAYVYGGGAYLGDGGTISLSLFQGNTASATGGEARGGTFEKGITTVIGPSADASASTVATASAYAFGGGAYLYSGDILSSSFYGNTASATGKEASGGTFKEKITTGNLAKSSASASASADAEASGGGVYLGGDNGKISSSSFHDNKASATGGVARGGTFEGDVEVGDSSSSSANASANAHAEAHGGGAYLGGDNGTISSSSFQGNKASATGGKATGGTFAGDVKVQGTGSSSASPDASASASAEAYGGGAYLKGKNGEISSSSFHGNTASAMGGEARSGTFTKKIIVTHDTANAPANASAFANAEAYGGGAYLGGDNGKISSSSFHDNTALAMGGGAYGGLLLKNSPPADASANAHGGGAYLKGDDGKISSSSFQGNKASATGGKASGGTFANEVAGSNLHAHTDPYADANAYGGGAYLGGQNGEISSSSFHDNTASATGGEATGGIFADNVDTDTNSSAAAGASSKVMAHGGGAYLGINYGEISSSRFYGNTASAIGGQASGGIFKGTVSIGQSTSADAAGDSGSEAYGGGAYLGGIDGTISSSSFHDNTASATGGEANGGTFEKNISSDSTNSQVSCNATATAKALGGGAYLGGNDSEISSSRFLGNTASATGGKANGGTLAETIFDPSSPGTILASASAYAEAYGGGAYLGGTAVTISSSRFQGNTVSATGGVANGSEFKGKVSASVSVSTLAPASAVAFAYGGGAYLNGNGNGTVKSSIFHGNSASAIGGERAAGATFVVAPTGTFSSWANADAYAFGGGAYFQGGTIKLEDSVFTYNSVTARADGEVIQNGVARKPEAEARGGAVFVNTNSNNTTLALTATAGKQVLIAGNTANGLPSGIHFGRGDAIYESSQNGYFNDSKGTTTFTVQADGEILMADPVTVEVYSATAPDHAKFIMTVGGSGTLLWGGKNVLDANGGATVTFKDNSSTVFLADYTLTATPGIDYRTGSADDAYARASKTNPGTSNNPLSVALGDGVKLTFIGARYSELALFDFTTATVGGTFTSASHGTVTVGIDVSRQLSSLDHAFLFADGITNTERDDVYATLVAGNAHVTGFDKTHNGQLWVNTKYASPYQPWLDQWRNSGSAVRSLEFMLSNPAYVTDEDFAAIIDNLDSTTPDQALDAAIAAFARMGKVADLATFLNAGGFGGESGTANTTGNGDGYPSLVLPRRAGGYRLWGGYVGGIDRMDSHGGYRGYREHLNGFVTGLSRDFASGSIGGYFAYTDSTLRMRGGANGRVEADGYSFGLVGRLTPCAVPGLAIDADAGFGFYDNDSRRFDGVGMVTGEFDQRLWTAGLGVSYRFDFGQTRLAPFLSGRYIHLEQDGMTERGGLTATRVGSTDGDSFRTELGARVSREYAFACGRGGLTPYVQASWRHEWGDRNVSALASFTGTSAPSFSLRSVGRDRDMLGLGAGLGGRYRLAGGHWLGTDIVYDASVGAHGLSHALTATVSLGF